MAHKVGPEKCVLGISVFEALVAVDIALFVCVLVLWGVLASRNGVAFEVLGMPARICKEWFFGLRCELTVAFGRGRETSDGGGSRIEGGGASGALFFWNLHGQGRGNRLGWHKGGSNLRRRVRAFGYGKM